MGTTIGTTPTSQTVTSTPAKAASTDTTTPQAPAEQPQQNPETESKHADSSRQHALGMRGQQNMQGQLIQKQLSNKIPSPADLARQREEKNAAKSQSTEANTATTFAPSKSVVQTGDVRMSPNAEYAKLEPDLKDKLSQQLWARMGKENRATLLETYTRMKSYGLWDQVKRVTGEKDHPEPHVKVKGHEFEVAGNSGGVAYEAYDGAELVKKMKSTGHFGEDGKIIGALHKGQRSMREWGDDRSLHISVGPGNVFDAHIDKVNPTNQPQAGNTKIDPVKGKNHHTTEVWPEKIRDKAKVPGVIVEANIVENREDGWHGGELKLGVKVEIKGATHKQKVQLPHHNQTTPNPVPQEIMEKIAGRVEKTKTDFPTPVGSNPDWVPTREAVAADVAAQIVEAARNGKTSIQIDLPQYKGIKGDQAGALATMKEIGEIVRNELIAARAALPEKDRAQFPDVDFVRGLTVSFGDKNQRGIVSMMQ